MDTMTREEAVRRWRNALRTKKECVERGIKILTEDYKRKYGEMPKHIEVW